MILVKDIVWFEVIVINTVPVDHREMLGEPATPARCRSALLALVMAKALIGLVRVGSVHAELRPDPNSI